MSYEQRHFNNPYLFLMCKNNLDILTPNSYDTATVKISTLQLSNKTEFMDFSV